MKAALASEVAVRSVSVLVPESGESTMARLNRSEVLDPEAIETVHVYNRVVRRCFLLGVIIAATHRADADNVWRFAASTGFVGSFTTFSTFVADSAMLGHEGNALRTGVYLAGNLLLGYGAYMLGRMLGQALRA